MNREQRRQYKKAVSRENTLRPHNLSLIPKPEWPDAMRKKGPRVLKEVWHSRKYIVQVFEEPENVERLSICRTEYNTQLEYIDRLTWEQLQQIKDQVGRGDKYAIEVYPKNCDVVNVANMRHLWILENPLKYGWEKGGAHKKKKNNPEQ